MIQTILVTSAEVTSKAYVALVLDSVYIGIFFTLLYLIIQPITGMFVNPSIVLNFLFVGKLSITRAVLIIIAEILGATVGAGLVALSYPEKTGVYSGLNLVPANRTWYNAFIAELVGGFIFNISINGHLDSDFGVSSKVGSVSVGISLAFLVYIIAPISSGSLNPARSIGPAFIQGKFKDLWIFTLAPSIGGILAGQAWTRLLKYPID